MSVNFEQLREQIRANQANNTAQSTTTNYNGDLFLHWDDSVLPQGGTATVRFIEHSEGNGIWVEDQYLMIPFNGTTTDLARSVNVKVPCMKMWQGSDPVLRKVSEWYKSNEALGSKYWRKLAYYYMGFDTNNIDEGVKIFRFSRQIQEVIVNTLMEQDFPNPVDHDDGVDFNIVKRKQGEFNNYSSSCFARQSRSLTKEERTMIKNTPDMKQFVVEKPSAAHQQAIMEMYEASIAGEAYSADRWGAYYKPLGQ